MFMTVSYTLEDVMNSYETLRNLLILKENEINGLHQERMKLWKSIAIVTEKLDLMCEHTWEKTSPYQFTSFKCATCGRLKNE